VASLGRDCAAAVRPDGGGAAGAAEHGNSGWVDTIWTFSLGLFGAGSAPWPVGGAAPNPRQWLVAALVAIWSLRLGPPLGHRMLRSRGARYRDYQSRTSAFFPLPPHKGVVT
jgi:steroid 5-alpha reductase family enzyme